MRVGLRLVFPIDAENYAIDGLQSRIGTRLLQCTLIGKV